MDNFCSLFFTPFLSLYQRQITACHQRCFPLLFFHNLSLHSPQNDRTLSGDLWGLRQSVADLSFTPSYGTRRRFLWKAPLAVKYDSSHSILIRLERLIVTACHVNCVHHSKPWAFHVCNVGRKTPTPVWVRTLKPERNLPLLATDARIDQVTATALAANPRANRFWWIWKLIWLLNRSEVVSVLRCGKLQSTLLTNRQLKPIRAGYYEPQW